MSPRSTCRNSSAPENRTLASETSPAWTGERKQDGSSGVAPGDAKAEGGGGAEGAGTWRFLPNTGEFLQPIKPSFREFLIPGSRMWACPWDLETCLTQCPILLWGWCCCLRRPQKVMAVVMTMATRWQT